jgi:hypothetical protein
MTIREFKDRHGAGDELIQRYAVDLGGSVA